MKVISRSVKDTLNLGKVIARKLKPGDIICLFGNLGSGKTVLTKGIAHGLKLDEKDIISPSFVLLRQYPQAKIPLYHFDLYRLKSSGDILALGYEEYLYSDGATVIEWAERLKGFLPKEYLKIEITIKAEKKRVFKLSAIGKNYARFLL
ncbi:MAG: tRNA (adenosine(37)-N6)-threonylcarbamoyltransferase complex ATPase subunit type 1 TsaE [Candidatus Omnitrophica bacterium]|nr:tRNA (adenosine(37)-N6)-threonylcarbamoyltransferase complex ATPase subunit type 1 TsaE [Candidatus Omnitrophota bacterium]MDD5653225.1 tRNA (adenosine(37)-N6)-threonylcarbamoyltransferase complex ATPase subunit type 1 TsaE [Candidatus Omnitrophota bacterium]